MQPTELIQISPVLRALIVFGCMCVFRSVHFCHVCRFPYPSPPQTRHSLSHHYKTNRAVNGFWSFMLALPWSWRALEIPWVKWLDLSLWPWRSRNCWKRHMKDCAWPGAGEDERLMWRVCGGGGLLSGRCLFNEISCDKGPGGGRPLASAWPPSNLPRPVLL